MRTANLIEAHRALYDSLADEYEARVPQYLAVMTERVNQLAELLPPRAQIIDIGCGVGLAMSLFRERGFETEGVELSERMASYCVRRNPNATILLGDFLTITFTRAYDLVFAQSFIHLFPESLSKALFTKLGSLVAPSGLLSVSTNLATQGSEGWLPKEDYAGRPRRFKRLFTNEALLARLSLTGCELVDQTVLSDTFGKVFVETTARKHHGPDGVT